MVYLRNPSSPRSLPRPKSSLVHWRTPSLFTTRQGRVTCSPSLAIWSKGSRKKLWVFFGCCWGKAEADPTAAAENSSKKLINTLILGRLLYIQSLLSTSVEWNLLVRLELDHNSCCLVCYYSLLFLPLLFFASLVHGSSVVHTYTFIALFCLLKSNTSRKTRRR